MLLSKAYMNDCNTASILCSVTVVDVNLTSLIDIDGHPAVTEHVLQQTELNPSLLSHCCCAV